MPTTFSKKDDLKKINAQLYSVLGTIKTAGNLVFSQTGSQFVCACAVDLRTSGRKGEEKPCIQTTIRRLLSNFPGR